MPLWRDLPAAVSVMERLGSTSRSAMLNANTASAEVLAAVLPGARPEQIELLKTLRAHLPFTTTEDVQRATGLVLRGDAQTPHVGPALRLTASASLGRRALQYNIVLLPAGRDAPWLISNAQPVSRGNPKDTLDRADPFPLAVPAALKP